MNFYDFSPNEWYAIVMIIGLPIVVLLGCLMVGIAECWPLFKIKQRRTSYRYTRSKKNSIQRLFS